MVIQHNISALNSHRNLGLNNAGTSKNLEKLSSGYRINRAADDAAGLAISEKMRGQIRGLAMAEQNTSHGINLIQTAEGGLNETHSILQRMRELAVQSSNGTYQDVDRTQLTKEYEALKSEVDRISESTQYNNIKLLDGSLSNAKSASVIEDTASVVSSFTLGEHSGAISGDVLKVELGAVTFDPTSAKEAKAAIIELEFGTADNDNMLGEELTLKVGNSEHKITLTEGKMNGVDVAELVSAKLNEIGKEMGFTAVADGTGKVTMRADEAGEISVLDTLKVSASSSGVDEVEGKFTIGEDATVAECTMDSPKITNETDGTRYNGGTATAIYNEKQNTWTITDTDAGVSITLDASKVPMEDADKITFSVIVNQGENLTFQIGANGGQDQRVNLGVADMSSKSIGLKEGDVKTDGSTATAAEAQTLADTNINDVESANKAIEVITAATMQVAGQRAELGALQNRLEHTMNNLGVTKENLTAAESTIRDVDMAAEMMDFTKNNILVQASQAMLSQANQLPQGVLQLLR